MATQILPELTANNRDNRVDGTARDDQLIVLGQILAIEQGRNLIDTGTGDDLISINGSLINQSNGVNEITMGAGNNTFIVAQDMLGEDRLNQVSIYGIGGETESQVVIGGTLRTQGLGGNGFILSGGDFTIDLGAIETVGGWNQIQAGDQETGHARLIVRNDLLTDGGGTDIQLHALEESSIEVRGNVETREGVTYLLISNQAELAVHGEVRVFGGVNQINLMSDSGDTITAYFGSNMLASGGGNIVTVNDQGGSTVNATIAGALITEENRGLEQSTNAFSLEGDTVSLRVGQGIWTSGETSEANLEIFAQSQAEVSITGRVFASEGGSNSIHINSADQAHVSINGNIEADADSSNSIALNAQQSHIELNGKVDTGALDITAGEHYDVLSLSALNYLQFSNFYQNWLSDLANNDAINTMNLEAIRIDMGYLTSNAINSLGWLDQLVDQHNSAYDNQIALELNIDRQGSAIQLSDLFTSSNGPSFSGLNMTGSISNTLDVLGSLSDNGIDGGFLRVLGDHQDSVALSGDWTLSQAGFTDETGLSYNVYSNAADELLIQSSISVV